MRLEDVIRVIRDRPGFWGLDGRYAVHVAFLGGWDAGNGGDTLQGFGEWLVKKYGRPDGKSNMAWSGLAVIYRLRQDMEDGVPEVDPLSFDYRGLNEIDSKPFTDFLYDNLEDFLSGRASAGSASR